MKPVFYTAAFVLTAGIAVAEITTEQRFQDCLGARAEAAGFGAWASSTCHFNGSCPDYTPTGGIRQARQACVAEIVEVCAASEQKYSNTCFDTAQHFLDGLLSQHSIGDMQAALARISGVSSRIRANRAQQLLAQMNAGFPRNCGIRQSLSVLESRERACAFERDVFKLLILDVIANFVMEVEVE